VGKKETKTNQKYFLSCLVGIENLGKKFPNTPTTSHNQPSLFFDGCDQEEPLGEQPDIFEEPIGEEEEEEEDIPLEPMAEHRNARGNGERIEGTFPFGRPMGTPK